jgi:hypothetical protein
MIVVWRWTLGGVVKGSAQADLMRYLNLMEGVKRRVGYVEALLNRKVTLENEQADYEIVSLQFRKILETVAFAALVANRAEYEAKHASFAAHWRAKDILAKMEKLNPDFYPVPFTIEELGPGRKHLTPIVDGVLTKEDFVFLYDRCSETIHELNPYAPGERLIDFRRPPYEWLKRVWLLLSNHFISFVGRDDRWLITMVDRSDGKVHGLPAVPVGPLPHDWKSKDDAQG